MPELAKLKEEMEEEYKSRLENNQKEMEEMAKTFEERLREAQLAGVSIARHVLHSANIYALCVTFMSMLKKKKK